MVRVDMRTPFCDFCPRMSGRLAARHARQRLHCRAALLPLVCLASLACTVGPNYRAPSLDLPDRWATSQPAAAIRQQPADAHALAEWWTQLRDPLLTSLVWRAVESNLDLQIAEARVREARARRGVVAADAFPQIDATGGYSRSRSAANSVRTIQPSAGDNLRTAVINGVARVLSAAAQGAAGGIANGLGQNAGQAVGGLGSSGTATLGGSSGAVTVAPERNLFQAGFDMAWELDVFGGTRRAVEAADADLAARQEEYRGVLVTLTGDVARSYIDLRSFQQRVDIAAENIRAQEDNLRLTQARFDAGLTSELDVAQARAQLAATQSQIPALQIGLYVAIYQLGVLLGQSPAALLDELVRTEPLPPAPPDVPVGLPAELVRRRPDVRRAERELAAATARVGEATADLYPKFSLTGSFGWQSTNTGTLAQNDSRAWSIAPGVRWPIFDAGRIRSSIAVRDAQAEAALAAYKRAVLTALQEVENAMVSYSREADRRKSLAESVAANRRAVELASQLYSNGLTDFLSVLESQRALYLSQDELAQSDRNVVADLIALFKALGGGWQV